MLHGGDFQIFGDGYNLRDYVYVKDVAKANLLALEYPQNGTFNIGTGVGTTTLGLFQALAKTTGYKLPARHTVARLGDLKKSLLDPNLAKKDLKWEPAYDLAAGLKETIEYYRKIS
jgi:UDP-glucose 4-epimerase